MPPEKTDSDGCANFQLPNSLFGSFSNEQKKAFLRWKNATLQGEKVSNDEISKNLKRENTGTASGGRRGKNKKRKTCAMKIRCISAQEKGKETCKTEQEWTVLGIPTWSVGKTYDKKLSMSAVNSAMSDVSMQCCDAVTSVLTRNGQTHLFGVRRGCYSPMLTDDEAVVNNHLIREAGW
eukprot:15336078-Ditylum_brightwellii.AAC.2